LVLLDAMMKDKEEYMWPHWLGWGDVVMLLTYCENAVSQYKLL
jgi:hypothetical protein